MAFHLIPKCVCDHCCPGVDQLISFGDVGILCNAALISSSRPSDCTSCSLGNKSQRVQVCSFAMILSLRSVGLALNTTSVALGAWCPISCRGDNISPVAWVLLAVAFVLHLIDLQL